MDQHIDYQRIETSTEVYWMIWAQHHESLRMYRNYASPSGSPEHPGEGRMETAWMFPGATAPIVERHERWTVDPKDMRNKLDIHNTYYLCMKLAV